MEPLQLKCENCQQPIPCTCGRTKVSAPKVEGDAFKDHVWRVVMTGPRHIKVGADDVIRVLGRLKTQFKGSFFVMTTGCDSGIGKLIKDMCAAEHVEMIEYSATFSDGVPPLHREIYHYAKHAAFLELGEVFHLWQGTTSIATNNELIERVKAAKLPYTLYGSFGAILDESSQKAQVRPL